METFNSSSYYLTTPASSLLSEKADPSGQLKTLIKALGWTSSEFAREIGKDEKQVRRWTTGEYTIPGGIFQWLKKRVSNAKPAAPGEKKD